MTRALSVVIVNYNAGEHLARCLRSLDEHLTGFDWDAVIVDNASADGSQRAVDGCGPRVALLQNERNVGFGAGVNQGVARTAAPFVLIINPDAWLTAGAADALVSELDQRADCGAIGPTVVDEDGAVQGSARGDPDMLTGLFGRTSLLSRLFPGSAIARRNVVRSLEPQAGEVSVEVDWVSGSCVLVRRDAFARVSGFDERYFLFWEDADLCRRMRAAGFRTRYRPDARVAHTVGQSSKSARALSIRAFHDSAYRYYSTHVAPSPLNPLRWLAYVLLRARCWWRLAKAASRG